MDRQTENVLNEGKSSLVPYLKAKKKPFFSQRIEAGLEHIPLSFSVWKFFRASTVEDGRAEGGFKRSVVQPGRAHGGGSERGSQVDTSNLEALC